MTIVKAVLPSSGEQQLALWNKSGTHVVPTEYHPTAGMHWALVGCVMADAFDPDVHGDAFEAAAEGLPEVSSVHDPIVYGKTPATIDINPAEPADPTHRCILCVESVLAFTTGYGTERTEKEYNQKMPPVAKQWLMVSVLVPDALNAAGITALEAAIADDLKISGQSPVLNAYHLMNGTIRADASGVSMVVTSRIRIDEIQA